MRTSENLRRGAVVCLLGILLSSCANTETPGQTEAEPTKPSTGTETETTEPVKPAGGGEVLVTGNVGSTVYNFAEVEGSFCRMTTEPMAVSVSGLVDAATGAEVTIDYAQDSPDTATMIVDGGPEGHTWQVGDGLGDGLTASRKDDGSIVITGQFVDPANPGGLTGGGGATVSC